MPRWMTIRQTAKVYELPEWTLRTMQKQGKLPGFYQSSRYYVDTVLLMEQLDQTSRAAVTTNKEASA